MRDGDATVTASQQELTSIIHQLAGVKNETRDDALDSLTAHLKAHGHNMDTLDYSRLWQGLLTCTSSTAGTLPFFHSIER